MTEYRCHFDPGIIGRGVLCKEPNWHHSDTDREYVTCRRCLYLLGLYMPTDPERREELTKRQNELTKR